MIGLGYRDLHPDDDLEVEDRRHPLRGEQVIVQVCCEVQRQTARFYALPHHEQRRQAAAKDAP